MPATEQVLVRLRSPVEDVPLELVPKRRIHDRQRLHLAALREDREPPLRVVEVTKLHTLESALADALFEQQVERETIAAVVLSEDRSFLVGREGCSLNAPLPGRTDRPGRVAMQAFAESRPLEEALEDRDVLRSRS